MLAPQQAVLQQAQVTDWPQAPHLTASERAGLVKHHGCHSSCIFDLWDVMDLNVVPLQRNDATEQAAADDGGNAGGHGTNEDIRNAPNPVLRTPVMSASPDGSEQTESDLEQEATPQ